MSDIIGFEACTQELKRLLDEIAENIKASGEKGPDELHAAVLTETRKLVEFTNRTEPKDFFDADEVENIRKIDQAADGARREIFGDSVHAIISHMQDRVSQLNQLEKAVRQQTADNERKAKELRLIPVRNAIDSVTDAIGAFNEAKDILLDEDSNEAAIKSKIESVMRAITALKKAAQDL
ncbi:MAG: hypothetical protein JRJ86_02570 [Deltaproteobacteria bacterium]|nr:hypothetical protein [Deltaproteobacteria bacterium]MBW2116649.1 hypothetical protein [Deltaproteobacteria bacterium]MBW2343242.1 hypothetical protein [Deltaproteobacteria bacterium]